MPGQRVARSAILYSERPKQVRLQRSNPRPQPPLARMRDASPLLVTGSLTAVNSISIMAASMIERDLDEDDVRHEDSTGDPG